MNRRVDRVDRREVGDVGQEDRRLDDVRPGQAGGVEDGREVAQGPLGLGLDAVDELAGRRIEPELAGAEEEPVGRDRLAVRADRRRGAASSRSPVGSSVAPCLPVGRSAGDRGRADATVHRRRNASSPADDQPSRRPAATAAAASSERRIEDPERRARARQARPAGRAGGRAPAGTAGSPGRPPLRPGQEVVGDGQDPGPVEERARRSARRAARRRGAASCPGGAAPVRRRRRPRTRRRPPAWARRRPGCHEHDPGRPPTSPAAGSRARRDPRRGPRRRPGRTARPSRAGRRPAAARRSDSDAPQASRAPSMAAAASLLPPARPAADRDPLLEPGGQRRRRPGRDRPSPPPTAARVAAIARRTRLSGDRARSRSPRRGACRRRRRRAARLSRSASPSGTMTEWSS